MQRLNVSLVPFNDPHDTQAIVVEAPLGAWVPELDTRGLLLFAGAEMFVSRFSLVPVGADDMLVVEAAMPFASVSFPVFDRMVREVASVAMHVLGLTSSGE